MKRYDPEPVNHSVIHVTWDDHRQDATVVQNILEALGVDIDAYQQFVRLEIDASGARIEYK